jgi:integrase
MSVYQRGSVWWYSFVFAGRRIQESAKTENKTIAKNAEKARRRELELSFNGLTAATNRKHRLETIAELSVPYLEQYRLKHRAPSFAECCIRRLLEHVGSMLPIEINAASIAEYQSARLKQQAAPKSINEETTFLLRLLGPRGDLLRSELHRKKMLKLAVPSQPGKAYSEAERDRLKLAAEQSASPHILFALSLAQNMGMRDAEMKNLRWSQIDFNKEILTVGRSKTEAGEGRTIPLNSEVMAALMTHVAWYVKQFGELRPTWYAFPHGSPRHMDPSRPVTTFSGGWETVRRRAGVTGRWHDNRHTLITELAESGAGDQTILDVAGHVSWQMLARYSHIRTAAKRDALEAVVTRRQKARQMTVDAATKQAAEDAAATVN